MSVKDLIDEAYLNWIQRYYAYMFFEETIRIKWERLTLEQGGRI